MNKLSKLLLMSLLTLAVSCNVETPITETITYSEALDLQSITFTHEEKTHKSEEVSNATFEPFFCFDWPGTGECGLGNSVYYKSYGVMIEESPTRQMRLILTPGMRVKESLIETPNLMYYDTRPAFKNKNKLEEKFLAEGSWINNLRNVKVKFMFGEPDTEFYFNDLLQDTDHFEIQEIQRISDRDHSFLISGAFNAIIPDGRTWLPVNEQAEPQIISDGSFHLIVEPLEEK